MTTVVEAAILANLVIEIPKRIPDKSWRPNELVDAVADEVKTNAATSERVSSAEIKSAIWRLAGDHQISMTPDRLITSVSSESETQTVG